MLSLCRVLYTLRTGEIVGKIPAARWAIRNLNPRWRPLIERAAGRYGGNDPRNFDAALRARAVSFALHETARFGAGPREKGHKRNSCEPR